MKMGLVDAMQNNEFVVVGGSGTRAMFFYGWLESIHAHPAYETFQKNLKGAAGTSSGCLVALAILLGANPTALAETAVRISREHQAIAPEMDLQLLFDNFGMDSGETLFYIIDNLMSVMGLSPSTTFASLQKMTGKLFVVCATDLAARTPFYFSASTSPELTVREAIFMSSCIPFMLQPKRYKGVVYVDGGLTNNFPIQAFPQVVPLVLAMKLTTHPEINSLKDFSMCVVCCTLSVQNNNVLELQKKFPDKIFVFCDRNDGQSVNVSASEEYLTEQRKLGFVSGAVATRNGVAEAVTMLLALCMKQQSPQCAPPSVPPQVGGDGKDGD
tara:strand:+ start:3315 stop:4298 length:984 start_codon:yes stop_codon:yes gene_type:complete